MHVISLILFGKAPVENLVTTGTILAEDGSKMSKSKNNFPDPWEVINRYGVDSLRFYLMNSSVMLAGDLNFSVRDLEGIYRKVVLILWNSHKYLTTYAKEAGWRAEPARNVELTVLDRWINVRTQELVNGVTDQLDQYDTVHATRLIEGYVTDLSTWYVRRSRGRKDDAFFATLYGSLMTVSKIIAPVMPYLAEAIYRQLIADFGDGAAPAVSVHLADWPMRAELAAEDQALIRDMAAVREAASLGLAARKELKIPVRQPLASLKIKNEISKIKIDGELVALLMAEVNVKEVVFGAKIEKEVELDATLTDELKLEGLVRGLERLVQEIRKKKGLRVGEAANLVYVTDDADIKRALEMFDKKKTYISGTRMITDTEETRMSTNGGLESHELDGKKIALGVERA
jgi:isoleucyl-tRNA synthetase